MTQVQRYASVNGIQMHYVSDGPAAASGGPAAGSEEQAPTVVLLHGFPDSRHSFDCQVPELVKKGYRCITPDLRGYGKTDKPLRGYDLDTLGRDIAELIEHIGGPVQLVGHDWGAAIAWNVISFFPELVSRAVVINGPHPVIFGRALMTNRKQLRRSWYFFFFRLPRIPERYLTKNDGARIATFFRDRPSPPEIVDAARRSLIEPGAIGPAIEYYRTAVRAGLNPAASKRMQSRYGPVTTPVTCVWGVEDTCLGEELLDGTERYARDLTIHRVPDAGHFVHQERPEEVNRLLLAALDPPVANPPVADPPVA